MHKSSHIHVMGTQVYPNGTEDKVDFLTVGSFHERQGDFYIMYQESETTGMSGVSTALKVEKDKVTLNRMGAANLRQIFERGVLHHSTYVTPYGSIYLSALTEEMEISLTEQGGHITLKYNLIADREPISQNTLRIIIKEDAPQ